MTAVDTGLSTIEHLDFEFQQPCEHGNHNSDAPAMFLLHRLVTCCKTEDAFCCLPCWEMMGSFPYLRCGVCKVGFWLHRDECLKIIRVLAV